MKRTKKFRIVTKRQITAFGNIVYHYAALESGMKILISELLQLNLGDVLILCEPHTAMGFRNAAKSILKEYITGPLLAECVNIIGEGGAIGPLRNHIAHSRWTKGVRRGSIKPFGIDIRQGRAQLLGRDPREKDWTAEELEKEGKKLEALNGRIVHILDSVERARARAASRSTTEASTGNS